MDGIRGPLPRMPFLLLISAGYRVNRDTVWIADSVGIAAPAWRLRRLSLRIKVMVRQVAQTRAPVVEVRRN